MAKFMVLYNSPVPASDQMNQSNPDEIEASME